MYDQSVFNRIIAKIELVFRQIDSRQRVEGTSLNLSNLPTSSSGLASGEVWNDSGTLKIVA